MKEFRIEFDSPYASPLHRLGFSAFLASYKAIHRAKNRNNRTLERSVGLLEGIAIEFHPETRSISINSDHLDFRGAILKIFDAFFWVDSTDGTFMTPIYANQDIEKRILHTDLLFRTFFDHPKSLGRAKVESSRAFSIDEERTLIIDANLIAHEISNMRKFFEDFSKKGEPVESVEIKSWIFPGAYKMHETLKESVYTNRAAEAFMLSFAFTASPLFHKERSYLIAVPEFTDPDRFSDKLLDLGLHPVKYNYSNSAAEVAHYLFSRFGQASSLQSINIVEMGRVPWSKQSVRKSVNRYYYGNDESRRRLLVALRGVDQGQWIRYQASNDKSKSNFTGVSDPDDLRGKSASFFSVNVVKKQFIENLDNRRPFYENLFFNALRHDSNPENYHSYFQQFYALGSIMNNLHSDDYKNDQDDEIFTPEFKQAFADYYRAIFIKIFREEIEDYKKKDDKIDHLNKSFKLITNNLKRCRGGEHFENEAFSYLIRVPVNPALFFKKLNLAYGEDYLFGEFHINERSWQTARNLMTLGVLRAMGTVLYEAERQSDQNQAFTSEVQ